MDLQSTARQLLDARASITPLDWRALDVHDADQAYAVQDACIARLGPVGGWKVGNKGPGTPPSAAPLPAAGVLASGARLSGEAWRLRGLEVELALRVGRDLGADEVADTPAALATVFDAFLPTIEVVERRLGNQPCENPWASLADLQSHGALVIGQAQPLAQGVPALRSLVASLSLDGQQAVAMTGGNPVGDDLWPLLAWLVRHSAARGLPLRRGQIVTTGSCTGMMSAAAGQQVRGEVAGVGVVELTFAA